MNMGTVNLSRHFLRSCIVHYPFSVLFKRTFKTLTQIVNLNESILKFNLNPFRQGEQDNGPVLLHLACWDAAVELGVKRQISAGKNLDLCRRRRNINQVQIMVLCHKRVFNFQNMLQILQQINHMLSDTFSIRCSIK